MRRLLLPALVLIAGNLALLGGLKGRDYALVHLAHDTNGRILNAAPGPDHVARSGRVQLDYGVALSGKIDVPPATGAGSGLADVRAVIAWVRSKFSVGDDYHAESWFLADALSAAGEEQRRFMCDSYARALVNASLRQGYSARVVLLDGYISSEIFLPALNQWVFADALYDFIASSPEGEPLSALEASNRLRRGEPVVWAPVVGERNDDDDLHLRNRSNVETMMRVGRLRIVDGALGFGRITRMERAMDFLLGRIHTVEYSIAGIPGSDRDERTVRTLLLVWNLGLPLAAGLLLSRRDRAPEIPGPAAFR